MCARRRTGRGVRHRLFCRQFHCGYERTDRTAEPAVSTAHPDRRGHAVRRLGHRGDGKAGLQQGSDHPGRDRHRGGRGRVRHLRPDGSGPNGRGATGPRSTTRCAASRIDPWRCASHSSRPATRATTRSHTGSARGSPRLTPWGSCTTRPTCRTSKRHGSSICGTSGIRTPRCAGAGTTSPCSRYRCSIGDLSSSTKWSTSLSPRAVTRATFQLAYLLTVDDEVRATRSPGSAWMRRRHGEGGTATGVDRCIPVGGLAGVVQSTRLPRNSHRFPAGSWQKSVGPAGPSNVLYS